LLILVARYSWGLIRTPLGSLGFGLWLQLMHCAYLLSLSEYFKWGQTFRLWVKSETSLHSREHRKIMELEVQHSESAFGVTVGAVRMRFLSIMYAGWCKLYKLMFKMGHNTHE